jgi:putative membrane protein
VLFGLALLWMNPVLLSQPWMIVKLFFVAILVAYHFWGHRIFKAMYEGRNSYKPMTLRFLNEVSTLILISVVFLVVRKDELSWVWGVLSIVGIALIITFAVRRYAALRRGKDAETDRVE